MFNKINIRKIEFYLIIYIILISFLGIFIGLNVPLSADGGTHLLLSEFYKDLISNLPLLEFDINKIYNFGINYLIHYPKLTITYLPLYHLNVALLFSFSLEPIFGVIILVFYFILTSIMIYFIGRKFTKNKKQAVIPVLLFTLSPEIFKYIYNITVDYTAYFFSFLTIFLFLNAIESKKNIYFTLSGISSFLTFFSRIFAIFPLLSIVFYIIIFEKKYKFKKLLLTLVPFLILFIPFFITYNSVGGLEASKFIIKEAETMPWVSYDLLAPFYYFIHYTKQTYGLGLLIFISSFIYIYKNLKHKKLNKSNIFLLLWFIFAYVIISYFQNPRYVSYILIPLIFWSSSWFAKIKLKYLIIFLIIFSIIPVSNAYNEINEKKELVSVEREISRYLFDNGGNVGLLSEEPIFSSVFIYYISTFDKNKTVSVYRPCFFYHFLNESKNSLINKISENDIKTILVTRNSSGYEIIENIKEYIYLNKSFYTNKYVFDVYSVRLKGETQQRCNYICVTGYYLCTNLSSPYDLFK